jgi:ArsR family transcriptional regulator
MKSEFVRVFRALSDENRVRILEMLCAGEQCACVLLEGMSINQPTLSYHMKILCESGIVKSRRSGKWNYYAIDPEGCEYAKRLLDATANGEIDRWLSLASMTHHTLHPVRRLLGLKTLPESVIGCCCGQTGN